VLLWSSYARNANPLDFPVPLSRTRFTSTTSPYLPKGKTGESSDLPAGIHSKERGRREGGREGGRGGKEGVKWRR
jgi:hypothetical protein